ncbi:hypothetical protein HON52_02765 [Candidatus Uhrbacteria bacterium]|jgi:hypothetical protein|nr:hypothetical protein [Candidatus Uhrbacteria bacterium]
MRVSLINLRHIVGAILLLGLASVPAMASAAFPVPDGVVSSEIGAAALGSGWEPSGVVWHEDRGTYIVVSDDGVVAELSTSGALLNEWTGLGYDLEGVTVVDPSSSLVYLAGERTGLILEFDLASGSFTGTSWDISAFLPNTASNQGLEALTFVPDGTHPYGDTSFGGLFYAGLQQNGNIYIVNVDSSPVLEGTVVSGITDISGLSYDSATGYLVAVHDGYNVARMYTPAGALLGEMVLPGDNQEGVATHVSCPDAELHVTIAEDAGSGASEVWVYSFDEFPLAPITCASEEPEELECIAIPSDTSTVKYVHTSDCQSYVASDGRFVRVYDDAGSLLGQRYLYRKVPGAFDLAVEDLYGDGVDEVIVATMPPRRSNGRIAILRFDGSSLTKNGFAKTPVSSDRTVEIEHVDAQFGSVVVNYGSDQVMFGVFKGGKVSVAEL